MALTNSRMLPLGTTMPAFTLPDVVSGVERHVDAASVGRPVLVMFLCRHCPYVVHVQDELARLGRDYASSNLCMLAISSNDAARYPDDSPAGLQAMAETLGFAFPVYYDESQEVAKAFTAACTPECFLFGNDGRLVYRGQLDGSRPGNGIPVTGEDVRAAIDAVLAGRAVGDYQRPSAGCNIKWKLGNEPEYA